MELNVCATLFSLGNNLLETASGLQLSSGLTCQPGHQIPYHQNGSECFLSDHLCIPALPVTALASPTLVWSWLFEGIWQLLGISVSLWLLELGLQFRLRLDFWHSTVSQQLDQCQLANTH